MFPFVPLEVRQILLKGKSLLRPGATTTEQQFGAATDDGIVVKLHVGGSQRVEEELGLEGAIDAEAAAAASGE